MRFKTENACIYCGATNNLTDEHIIPFGLSGDHVLPKASCKRCATVTSELERVVLRGELWATRLMRGLRSRRSHRLAPKDFPIEFERNGVWKRELLPLKDYPVLLHFPRFAPPRCLSNPPLRRPGIDISGVDIVSFGPNPEIVLSRTGAQSLRTTAPQRPVEFARMLAKIGFSMAAASGQLKRLALPSPLPGVILGEDSDIGSWVGNIAASNPIHSGDLHRISIGELPEQGLLFAEVQLFCDSSAPVYCIVLGTLRNDA